MLASGTNGCASGTGREATLGLMEAGRVVRDQPVRADYWSFGGYFCRRRRRPTGSNARSLMRLAAAHVQIANGWIGECTIREESLDSRKVVDADKKR